MTFKGGGNVGFTKFLTLSDEYKIIYISMRIKEMSPLLRKSANHTSSKKEFFFHNLLESKDDLKLPKRMGDDVD
jgi:hypothetical protein